MSAPTTSLPVDELRIGAVKAAFWENETDGGRALLPPLPLRGAGRHPGRPLDPSG